LFRWFRWFRVQGLGLVQVVCCPSIRGQLFGGVGLFWIQSSGFGDLWIVICKTRKSNLGNWCTGALLGRNQGFDCARTHGFVEGKIRPWSAMAERRRVAKSAVRMMIWTPNA